MMKLIKPAPGQLVRDPETRCHLPPEGREVVLSTYWIRRLREGSVVVVDKPIP